MDKNELTGYPSVDRPWLKYYREEAINAKLPECTVYEYLYNSNKDFKGNIALNYFGRRISFGELFENIERTAEALTASGVKKGDVVMIASVTLPETVYAFYALNRLGAVSNFVDPRTSAEGIREYINECGAELVITVSAAYQKLCESIKGTGVKKTVVQSPADSLPGIKRALYRLANREPKLSEGAVRWSEFMRSRRTPVYAPYEKDSCCVIVHTGGTTGSPKGVMLSSENLNALVMQSILTDIDMQRHHTWLDIMPPFIAYGIGMGLCLPLIIGMETILVPAFDAKKFDSLLLKHKANHMVFVPSYWGTIINSPKLKNTDLSFIIAPTVGGDKMDTALEEKANEFLHAHNCTYNVTKGYGMTEVCAGVSGTLDSINEIGSVGVPFVKCIVSAFDPDTGRELKYGEIGEICITGPNIMLGYHNDPEATAEVIHLHEDGRRWVHSGDLGYISEQGSIFIMGRIKRMIIRHDGFKVFPTMIENTVQSSGLVESCCAVGRADPAHVQGKLPTVYVQLADPSADREKVSAELRRLCQAELPEYAQPTEFIFIDTMPLTPIGKIDYRALEKEAV